MSHVVIALRVLLLVVFLVAVSGKLTGRTAWREFVGSVRELRLIPSPGTPVVAATVVAGETAVAVAMIVAPVAGFVLAGSLLCVLSITIAVTLRRGVRVRCRCFGTAAGPLRRRNLVRNGALLAATAVGLAGSLADPAWPPAAGVAVATAAGVVGAVVVVGFDEIVDLYAMAAPRPAVPPTQGT